MMTPNEWDELMHAAITPAQVRSTVAREARKCLLTLKEGQNLSTNALVEKLYAREVSDKTLRSDTARSRLYTMLAKLAIVGLEDCCKKGEVQGHYMGRPKRPWVWFRPPDQEICCMCGQPMPAESV